MKSIQISRVFVLTLSTLVLSKSASASGSLGYPSGLSPVISVNPNLSKITTDALAGVGGIAPLGPVGAGTGPNGAKTIGYLVHLGASGGQLTGADVRVSADAKDGKNFGYALARGDASTQPTVSATNSKISIKANLNADLLGDAHIINAACNGIILPPPGSVLSASALAAASTDQKILVGPFILSNSSFPSMQIKIKGDFSSISSLEEQVPETGFNEYLLEDPSDGFMKWKLLDNTGFVWATGTDAGGDFMPTVWAAPGTGNHSLDLNGAVILSLPTNRSYYLDLFFHGNSGNDTAVANASCDDQDDTEKTKPSRKCYVTLEAVSVWNPSSLFPW